MRTLAGVAFVILVALCPCQAIKRRWNPLPSKYALRFEGVRQALHLLPAQERKIVELLHRQMKAMEWKPDHPPKTKQEIAAYRETADRSSKAQTEARDQAFALLTPNQKHRLKELELQMSGGVMLLHPQVQKELKLSTVQCQHLAAIDGRFAKLAFPAPGKWHPIKKDEADRYRAALLSVLTPAQSHHWQSMLGRRVPVEKLKKNFMNPRRSG
jgi:hypothetical protein